MRAVRFPDRAGAEAAKRPGEVVVMVNTAAGVEWGVLPATVEVETPTGTRAQPIVEFLDGYWRTVESEAQKRVRL